MRVMIPSALRSYTQSGQAEAEGETLALLLDDLERRYPGIRFRMVDEQGRIRRHIRIFINGAQEHDLGRPLRDSDEIIIAQALSGG